MHDKTRRQSEEAIDLSHLLTVAAREVIVDRDNMDALSLDGVEIRRKRRDEGFTLTCLHLGDTTLMQDNAAHELHAERALAEDAVSRLSRDRESLREDIVKRLYTGESRLEFIGHPAELFVAHRLVCGTEGIYLVNERKNLLDLPLAVCSEYFIYKFHL